MELEEIGYISKTHGLKGHVILKLKEDVFLKDGLSSLFLEINGSNVPYFIEEIKLANQGYIVKLETIDTVDPAKKLIGKRVSCLVEFIEVDEDNLDEFIGYAIRDHEYGTIGVISEVNSKTENVIIKVNHPSGTEIFLPFNDDFIIEIDDDVKLIDFKAPEGLIALYLG